MSLIKIGLLQHYASKQPHEFFQIDGFYMPEGGDSIMQPDEQGNCIMTGHTTELMSTCPTVRVLIPHGSKESYVAVKQLLKKIVEHMEKDNFNWRDDIESGPAQIPDSAADYLAAALDAALDVERRRRRTRAEDEIAF